MLTPGPIYTDGTVDDLITDARLHGMPMNQRRIMDWQTKGLIDYPIPQAGLGRGKGREKSRYPRRQRELFRALILKRDEANSIAALACVPVWLWLYWGDDYVPLRQVRRALRTHLDAVAVPTKDRARSWAERLRDTYAHPDADVAVTTKFVNVAARVMASPALIDKAMQDAFAEMIDPHGEEIPLGPPGAQVTPTSLLDAAFAKQRAIQLLLGTDEQIADATFNRTWNIAVASFAEYVRTQPELAAQAGRLSELFVQPTLQGFVVDSCDRFTSGLGLQIDAESRAKS
jgi:hypothetical protein